MVKDMCVEAQILGKNRTYENISTDQYKEVSKVFMSNLKSSQSVQVGINPMYGFLGGINGCSNGNITVNFPSE